VAATLTYRRHVTSLSRRRAPRLSPRSRSVPGVAARSRPGSRAGRAADFARRRLGPVVVVLTSVVVSLVATAAPASAHGSQLRTNDQATVSTIQPATPGLEVLVRATGLINLHAPGHGEIIVLGYEGEPYLRVVGDTVYENRHSPSTFLNRSFNTNVDIPPEATATATPDWVEIAHDGWARWHDHQLHRMGAAPGPLEWHVDLRIDGKPVAVTGQLVPLGAPIRWPWYALGGLVVVATSLAWQRFVRRRRALMVGALAVGFFAVQSVAVGVGGTLAWGATLATLVAFVITLRADAAWSAGMAGLLVAVVGFLQLADLGYAALFVTLPEGLYRGAVVVCLALGLVVAVWSFDITRKGGFRRALRP
jgi:hypothetical protein